MAFWQNLGLKLWFQPWQQFSSNVSSPQISNIWTTTPTTQTKTTLKTYNPRYPGFDEEDYKRLESLVNQKGLVGQERTQVMDQLYSIYYPQVLNHHKLNERQLEINDAVCNNWEALLEWQQEACRWLKITQLSQMVKQKFWVPYNVPDDQVITSMINNIPNGWQLMNDYLTNWNRELLYEAWLSNEVTDRQFYHTKSLIDSTLKKNWTSLSKEWIDYVQNWKFLMDAVELAKEKWIVWASDYEVLKILAKNSPEIKSLVLEMQWTELSDKDKIILWEKVEDNFWNRLQKLKNDISRSLMKSDTVATYWEMEMAKRAKDELDDNFWGQLWNKMKVESNAPLDSLEKFFYRTKKDIQNFGTNAVDWMYENLPAKSVLELQMGRQLTDDEYNQIVQEQLAKNKELRETNQREVMDYANLVNDAYQKKVEENLNPDIESYVGNMGMTQSLLQWNFKPFLYKAWWEMAQNWDMPMIIAASTVNPQVGFALMGMDSYIRENQEAFDELSKIDWVSYDTAREWAAIVWLASAAVELWLESALWWVETTTAKNIRKNFMKDYSKWVTDMVAKRGLVDLLKNGATTQFRASLEEWLEEVLQQAIHNIATTSLDKKESDVIKWLTKNLWESFEWGFYNPMNLLAGWTEMYNDYKVNKNAINQSVNNAVNDTAYKLWEVSRDVVDVVNNVWNKVSNKTSNIWDKLWTLPTRTAPEWMVENEMKLTPKERERVEKTWISAGNFILSENIANLSNTDKIWALENIASDTYNKITEIWNKIPSDKRITGKAVNEAHKLIDTMIKSLEKSDILAEEYADYINVLKQWLNRDSYTFAEGLALRRDFDQLEWSHIFNKMWEASNFEKATVAKWRANLNDALNNLAKEAGYDIKADNARISNAITIRNWLLRSLSQSKKNNYLGLQDLWVWAVLSSWHPVNAMVWVAGKKIVESKAWNIAQYLYNLNKQPLAPIDAKRWASFINKNDNNGTNDFRLNHITDMTTPANQQAWTQMIDVSNIDVWTSPLDAIPDRNVWTNPTDTVISENVNEVAWNQAQELYNQSDNILSDTPTDMTEKTKKSKKSSKWKTYADSSYKPSITMTEEEINNREEKNNSNEVMEDFTKTYKYNRLQADMKAAEDLFWRFMAEYYKTWIKDYMKKAQQQQNEINRIRKEIDNYIKDYDKKN